MSSKPTAKSVALDKPVALTQQTQTPAKNPSRADVLVNSLRLRQANGTLKPDDMQAVNSLLAK